MTVDFLITVVSDMRREGAASETSFESRKNAYRRNWLIVRTTATDYIQNMTIVQVSWCDAARDVRRNYPPAFDGITERFSAPMAEYVFLDSIEQAVELRTRIMKNVPVGCEPYVQALLSCAGTAKDHWSAIAIQRHQ
jgi:hypothetical protein